MKLTPFLISLFLFATVCNAQQTDTLQQVTVQAFNSNKKWEDVPAAVAIITQKNMQRGNDASLVQVFNAVPGVRMEERSPGSYRLSIRGSTLRSPFGVRNVKIYWNDIPLTDGGGNTYLQVVDMSQLTGIEIIKGPAASVYGAGTGGAVLLSSVHPYSDTKQNKYSASLFGGSFGLIDEQAGWERNQKNFSMSLQQTHLQSDGYRQESALRKDVLKWDGALKLKNQEFHFLAFYTDMYYQTPGGITKAQMDQNPQLARQPAGALPGSVQQQAAIYNRTLFMGVAHSYNISAHFSTEASFVSRHTGFKNPFITDYENRDETNVGVRGKLIYDKTSGKTNIHWVTGGEWLNNHSLIDDYGNRNGNIDTVQFKDDVYSALWFMFSQFQWTVARFSLNAGVSLNSQSYRYKRFTDASNLPYMHTSTEDIVAPRLAFSYEVYDHLTLYLIVAKGFSPPTIAEVHPADKLFHGDLQPEYGWNYELGVKGGTLHNRLLFDFAAYYLELKDAIVQRNNSLNQAYFVNAGGAVEKGIEAWGEYHALVKPFKFVKTLNVWSSYSYQPYFFSSYQQGTSNYSGNRVTGVPQNIFLLGVDAAMDKEWYLHITYNAVSKIPLTDANDEFADAYHLVQFKVVKKTTWNSTPLQLFFGVDNLLNERYSLGNDINAAGRRFYNTAAPANFYLGASVNW